MSEKSATTRSATGVTADPTSATVSTSNKLERTLSHRKLGMIAMGSALGTGLFLGSGAAISTAGPAAIISFAIASVIGMIIVLAMAEMASRYPVRGGFGSLAARFISPFWGFLVRWLYAVVAIAVTAAEVLACATYLGYWFPNLPMWVGAAIFAIIIITVNVISVGTFGVVEFFLSTVKVVAVLVFIAVGLLLIFVGVGGTPAVGLGNWTNDGGFAPAGFNGIWLAMAFVVFSFGGIEVLSISAAEAADPQRAVRVAARTTVVRLSFFYVAAVAIVVALVPWRQAGGLGKDVEHSPFVLAFHKIGIEGAAHLTNIVVLIAALSAANAMLYAGSRFFHSLADDGLAPRILARTSRRGVPVFSLVVAATGLAIVVVLTLAGAQILGNIMALASFIILLIWLLILATYLCYFRNRGERQGFNLLGGQVTAIIGIAGLLFVLSTAAVMPHMQLAAQIGVPFVAAVSLGWLFLRRTYRGDAQRQAFAEADSASS
ncbi:MAG: amino acid permease [Microbacteriaceae bacterium]|nr:amino acid permease [Microbacteriaceae bacterium]